MQIHMRGSTIWLYFKTQKQIQDILFMGYEQLQVESDQNIALLKSLMKLRQLILKPKCNNIGLMNMEVRSNFELMSERNMGLVILTNSTSMISFKRLWISLNRLFSKVSFKINVNEIIDSVRLKLARVGSFQFEKYDKKLQLFKDLI